MRQLCVRKLGQHHKNLSIISYDDDLLYYGHMYKANHENSALNTLNTPTRNLPKTGLLALI